MPDFVVHGMPNRPQNGEAHAPSESRSVASVNNQSEEVQEILSRPPDGIMRWGITCILIMLVSFLCISWFIKYPDTLKGPVSIKPKKPVINLVSPINGYLTSLSKQNHVLVKKGDTLARFRNETTPEALAFLEALNIKFEPTYLLSTQLPEPSVYLGEADIHYKKLKAHVNEYQLKFSHSARNSKFDSELSRIRLTSNLVEISRLNLTQNQMRLKNALTQLEMDSLLFDQGALSKSDLLISHNLWLLTSQSVASAKGELTRNLSEITRQKQELANAQKLHHLEESALLLNIQESFHQIRGFIDHWNQNNTIVCPENGRLVYSPGTSLNQYVNQGTSVFSIVPDSGELTARVEMSPLGLGKVKIGQSVRIQVDRYPHQQFGSLQGEVIHIPLIPENEAYFVEVKFPDGLLTNTGATLPYKPAMKGNASIIVDNPRILEKVYRRLLGSD